jgi:acetyltransferase
MFQPRSVALIGASQRPGSVGNVMVANMRKAGFAGPVMPVNPKGGTIEGLEVCTDIDRLPQVPDLAVIATPPETVPGLIGRLGAAGTRAAIVLTAGFGESADAAAHRAGAGLRQRMLEAAQPYLLRIAGPNCVGVMVPSIGLNAGFAHLSPARGNLAFVAQSGAVIVSVLDWAAARDIGFSHFVSLGDMADVDFGDMLDYLARDRETHAILLYIEAISHARKFMSAARAAARGKPVVVVKAGRHEAGARAAASHTGALAGTDAVYDTAFRRAGMLRVRDLEDLFGAVETLAMLPRSVFRATDGRIADRLAVLTNGGGLGVLAADGLADVGGRLAELSADTLARLDAVLPATWSHGNPVDIIGDAPGERYSAALQALLEAPECDAVLVLNCPTAIASADEAAQAVVGVLGERNAATAKPVLTSWVGAKTVAGARARLNAARIPTYDTPGRAVRAFMQAVEYTRNQVQLRETPLPQPDAFTPDEAAARRIIAGVLADDREWLTGEEAAGLLAAYGVPMVSTRVARDATSAAREAAALIAEAGADRAPKLALKILSRDIVHKSDVGGVALGLADAAAVGAAAEAMRARVAEACPGACIDGFMVQPMVERPAAHELIVGLVDDVQFGPVIMFGQGGTAVELVDDKALALPPLNLPLARDAMRRTRVWRLLRGYRDRAPADTDAIASVLLQLAQVAVDHGTVKELEINPLLADADGVIAVDARVRVTPLPPGAADEDRLAILPYPKRLETPFETDGRHLLLRPVRPEDEPAFRAAFAHLRPEDIRMRFFAPLATLDHDLASRLTQIDYDREMAFVLVEADGSTGDDGAGLYGVVRLIADPDGERGEFAVIVRPDMAGRGIGSRLVGHIVDYGRRRGLATVWGDVLRENSRMRALCTDLGFRETSVPDEPTIVRVARDLQADGN